MSSVPTLGQPPSEWCTLALLKVTGWELQSPVNMVGVNWVLLPSCIMTTLSIYWTLLRE